MIDETISHYKILEKLGEGGMGVVYKAQDLTLDRLVALKFLPSQLSASEQDKLRFTQEAKAASAMNHPHICTIHAIEEHEKQLFIVMEYVEGQTLRERIGSLSLKQAIDIGIQVGEALGAAHDKGIVHRDIKPENIMIRKDGNAQIMDFGLAKLRSSSSKINRLTKEGSTVGTAGYMSPEQVQGLDVDHRSDIFAFGVLLYEMFTGQLPFKGVHETALAYEIVNVDPAPMTAVKPELDPALDAIVLECLEKDPRERTQSAAQVGLDLKRYRRESSRQRASRVTAARPAFANSAQRSSSGSVAAVGESPEAPSQSARIFSVAGLVPWVLFLLVGVAAAFLYFSRGREIPAAKVSAFLLPPEGTVFSLKSGSAGEGQFAISPDGKKLAFVATDSLGRTNLYIRSLESLMATAIPGTDGSSYPFWSPDNHWIGFFQAGKLKKVASEGGPAETISDAQDGRGGTWSTDGTIVFSPNYISPLSKVSSIGGSQVVAGITKFDSSRHEQSHRWPYFLPDGNRFLYFGRASFGGVENNDDAVCVGSLDGKTNKVLFRTMGNVAYANGYILFLRETTLMAQRFDPEKLELSGDPVTVAGNVEYDLGYNKAIFSVSSTGLLVYQKSTMSSKLQAVGLDTTGALLTRYGEQGEYTGWQFSPDGKFIAADEYDARSRNRDIWITDIDRGVKTRFTFDPAADENPVWSPDGGRIIFHSDRKGSYDLFVKTTTGASVEELLYESPVVKTPICWTSDGSYVLFTSIDPATKTDVWMLPMTGDRKPVPLLTSAFDEDNPIVSPNMRWLAYRSNESGVYELYVRPFLGADGKVDVHETRKWQISREGVFSQAWQVWGKDGKHIYYQSGDGRMMAVEIGDDVGSLAYGKPYEVVHLPKTQNALFIDVMPGNRGFVFGVPVGEQASPPLNLVVNWQSTLQTR